MKNASAIFEIKVISTPRGNRFVIVLHDHHGTMLEITSEQIHSPSGINGEEVTIHREGKLYTSGRIVVPPQEQVTFIELEKSIFSGKGEVRNQFWPYLFAHHFKPGDVIMIHLRNDKTPVGAYKRILTSKLLGLDLGPPIPLYEKS